VHNGEQRGIRVRYNGENSGIPGGVTTGRTVVYPGMVGGGRGGGIPLHTTRVGREV